jgi:hypothetical protein
MLEIDLVGGNLGGTLSSEWLGLSPHLLARFSQAYQAEPGGPWLADDSLVVVAPLTEADIDVTLNWQSPFEQSGPESSMPSLMAMLQSGAIQPVLSSLDALATTVTDATGTGHALNPAKDKVVAGLREGVKGLEGRTGMTRLNSTQVFAGMPPIKITVTALFRAWKDPSKEVEAPFNQLMAWALPGKLSELGPLLSRAVDYTAGKIHDPADVLAPSVAPTKLVMTYKGKTYAPLVIESIGQPLSSPIDSSGRYVELLVPMTLCTLTALDRDDWKRIGSP